MTTDEEIGCCRLTEQRVRKETIKELKTFINPKEGIFNEFCCPLCMFKKQLLDKLNELEKKE